LQERYILLNSIDGWKIRDLHPDKPLSDILPLSVRANSTVARHANSSLLKTGFINICGAIEMLEALEYHHDNSVRIAVALSDSHLTSETYLDHEAVAYINRIGQFYCFARSNFVCSAIGDVESLIPSITRLLIFRNKHTAHRSIDDPRNESNDLQFIQASAISSIIGSFTAPKPNMPPLPIPKSSDEFQVYRKDRWKSVNRFYQMRSTHQSHVHFTIEVDHPIIIREAFNLVERLILFDDPR
jgi:hypothetical protein